MSGHQSNRNLIVIAGPTAVGKTECSITIAEKLNTSIISADSRQFYREMKTGTAVPDDDQLQRAKHHFIGHLSIEDYYNVSMFEDQVISLLQSLFKDVDHIVMTGGSGLYIDAVCKGIDDLPDAQEHIRHRINENYKQKGIGFLRDELKRLDPEYYKAADPDNPNRLKRAIEVCLQTGEKYSKLRSGKPKKRDFNIIKIGLNRERNELFDRINRRVDKMIENGLIEEARRLYPKRRLNALNTVGYKELFQYFDGNMTLEDAIEKIKTSTRRYARRQLTWFRKDKTYKWFHPDDVTGIMEWLAYSS